VVGTSERQLIVLLICEVGGCVCLCVLAGVGEKKPLSLTPDDIFRSTSKASQGGRERCTGNRSSAAFSCSAPEENVFATAVCVCCVCVCVLVERMCFYFFLKQTGGGGGL